MKVPFPHSGKLSSGMPHVPLLIVIYGGAPMSACGFTMQGRTYAVEKNERATM
ncbi:hypothetical protein [Candidatus Merdisoma sp. JLR.KK006]|uniref:hypothetical protein n=1 Tax=Candidatus Merdisoma sp. JLR.KK006 TaxID=3112626 RepID=UPI002FF39EDC